MLDCTKQFTKLIRGSQTTKIHDDNHCHAKPIEGSLVLTQKCPSHHPIFFCGFTLQKNSRIDIPIDGSIKPWNWIGESFAASEVFRLQISLRTCEWRICLTCLTLSDLVWLCLTLSDFVWLVWLWLWRLSLNSTTCLKSRTLIPLCLWQRRSLATLWLLGALSNNMMVTFQHLGSSFFCHCVFWN